MGRPTAAGGERSDYRTPSRRLDGRPDTNHWKQCARQQAVALKSSRGPARRREPMAEKKPAVRKSNGRKSNASRERSRNQAGERRARRQPQMSDHCTRSGTGSFTHSA
ncbi:hypothetical protein EMIT0111MI5_30307 [Burkholderia sp. IT-111MI5]